MKQAQSDTARQIRTGRPWSSDASAPKGWRPAKRLLGGDVQVLEQPGSWPEVCLSLLSSLLYFLTLPFRVVFWTIAWVGRIAAILLGFCLMVVGIAFWAGPLFFVGIPLFLVGLVLTLKSLG